MMGLCPNPVCLERNRVIHMNFDQLIQAKQAFDEIMPIGREIEKEGKTYHIIGMARKEDKAYLYVMERFDPEKAAYRKPDAHCRNRETMKTAPRYPEGYFFGIAAIRADGQELKTESTTSGPLAVGTDFDCDSMLVFSEMMEKGWWLPEENEFASENWENIWLTTVTFHMAGETLPDWNRQEITIKYRGDGRNHYVEKPICLKVGEESEFTFSLEDGRTGTCYINRVYLIDIWKENEERFKDPRYLEFVTKEELEKQKEEFFLALEEDCPRGMYYLGIEYECTLAGSLVFYERELLEAEPKTHKGSARVMMMLLKPDEPIGKHGIRQHGCVIQTPLSGDVKSVQAELFSFMENVPEREESF